MKILKYILVAILVLYLLRLVLQSLAKVFGSPQQGSSSKTSRSKRKGNINIDHIPKSKSKKMTSKGFDDSDYIDYEEVKD